MSTSTPTPEEQANFAKLMRNIMAACGLVVFPVLAVLLHFHGDIPESRRELVMMAPLLGSVVSLACAVFMENLRRKSARGEMQPSADRKQSSGISIWEMLAFMGVGVGMVLGMALLADDIHKSGIAEELVSAETTFDLDSVRAADMMIETMAHPVARAVFVPSTEAGPKIGVVCAATEAGELELYTFGGDVLDGANKPASLNKRRLNSDLEAALPAFCNAAFAQIGRG